MLIAWAFTIFVSILAKSEFPAMQAYQGYFENGQFISLETVKIPERKRAILTVLDEPIKECSENKQLIAFQDFFDAINASDEEIPETFERVNFSRPIDL